MLDIGEHVGALVVYLPEACLGQEIEAEPAGDGGAGRDRAEPLVHTAVRERLMPGASLYAAVFPALAPGEYRLLRKDASDEPPLGATSVVGGAVVELHLV